MTIFYLNIDEESISDEWLIERMKIERNDLLAASDWTQTADNPISNKEEWASYRQQLRDFQSTWTPADTVEFPDPPS